MGPVYVDEMVKYGGREVPVSLLVDSGTKVQRAEEGGLRVPWIEA